MAVINLLDKCVYNRISAGEVVERPCSVVKEVVENSIDAKATEIIITIEGGGSALIMVKDNGCGIERNQLERAFLPHATSKIIQASDLDNIMTLGFRGEALASIGSVSKCILLSKTKEQELGAKIVCDGGEIGQVEDCASLTGTTFSCSDLFYNTPARAKFLKSDKTEEGEIISLVKKLALANPNISFRLVVDGKTLLTTYGGGLKETLSCVYDLNTLENCFEIESEKNGIVINGYVGKLNFTKPTRSYQTLIVNGRYVVDSTIGSAVQNAYGSYLMKRQYPFYCLSIQVPTDAVDVNVHPRKAEVRFSNNQIIYGAVYSVISKVLDGSSSALEIIKDDFESLKPQTDQTTKIKSTFNSEISNDKIVKDNKPNSDYLGSFSGYKKGGNYQNYASVKDKDTFATLFDSDVDDRKKPEIDVFAENKKYIERLEQEKQQKQLLYKQAEMQIEEKIRYAGQLYNTYLIFEKGNEVYFIDQHAAHERLLYDEFCQKANDGNVEVQSLLLPYVFNVSQSDYDSLYSKMDYVRQLGIEIDLFGEDAFKVSSIPCDLADLDLKNFFDDLLYDNEFKREKIPLTIKEKLMQKACKHAIKGGYTLSQSEIDSLMAKLDGNFGLKCPHGRPIAVKVTKTEIEKWFKRII